MEKRYFVRKGYHRYYVCLVIGGRIKCGKCLRGRIYLQRNYKCRVCGARLAKLKE